MQISNKLFLSTRNLLIKRIEIELFFFLIQDIAGAKYAPSKRWIHIFSFNDSSSLCGRMRSDSSKGKHTSTIFFKGFIVESRRSVILIGVLARDSKDEDLIIR